MSMPPKELSTRGGYLKPPPLGEAGAGGGAEAEAGARAEAKESDLEALLAEARKAREASMEGLGLENPFGVFAGGALRYGARTHIGEVPKSIAFSSAAPAFFECCPHREWKGF